MAAAPYVVPMLAQAMPVVEGGASLASQLGGGGWVFEPKLDGLRGLAVRNGDAVDLFSRNHLSFNDRFPTIVRALSDLPVSNFVLDGELVGLLAGRPDFGALQQGSAQEVEYWVFDMPWLLGRDLRHLPLEERRALVGRFVRPGRGLALVPLLTGEPGRLLEDACSSGWEGLVAKRAGSSYCEGRSADWRKLKCSCRQEFVIGGYTPPRNSRTGFGALLLGYFQGGTLVYAGKVGTGFTDAVLTQLHRRLAAMRRPTSPFAAQVREKGAQWAEPLLVAEVAFSNWTVEGRLRHPSFLGLRDDKAPGEVGREPCGPQPRPGSRGPRV
jgi:bifunctional non-homologous end joining protein LigD